MTAETIESNILAPSSKEDITAKFRDSGTFPVFSTEGLVVVSGLNKHDMSINGAHWNAIKNHFKNKDSWCNLSKFKTETVAGYNGLPLLRLEANVETIDNLQEECSFIWKFPWHVKFISRGNLEVTAGTGYKTTFFGDHDCWLRLFNSGLNPHK